MRAHGSSPWLSRGPIPDRQETNVPRPGLTPTILLVDDEPTPRAEAARLIRSGLKFSRG